MLATAMLRLSWFSHDHNLLLSRERFLAAARNETWSAWRPERSEGSAEPKHYHRGAVRMGIREYKSHLAGPTSPIGQRLSESSEILGQVLEKLGLFEVLKVGGAQSLRCFTILSL